MTMTPILRRHALRQLESACQAEVAEGELMERAGRAAAALAVKVAAATPGHIVILAGPGGNGGDAFVAARKLTESGISVRVAALESASPKPSDAERARERYQKIGSIEEELPALENATLVIDGLFGIGLTRETTGRARDWIEGVNAWQATSGGPVLALDIASGLDADRGVELGAAIRATYTLSFLAQKPCFFCAAGPLHSGIVTLETLGCDEELNASKDGFMISPELFTGAIKRRALDSNKGSFGRLGIVGGNTGMTGAGILCSRSALFAGAGRVYLQLLGSDAPAVDLLHPEIMPRHDFTKTELDVLVIGPGAGDDARALEAVTAALRGPLPLVIDADALNLIARTETLGALTLARTAPTILTPHPLEAARLLGVDAKTIQADRIGAALAIARKFNATVALKGAGTVVANANGFWAINPTGNPALATAGTGDVLSGLTGALLAQGAGTLEAVLAAVWIHGRAADLLVAEGIGPIGVSASEFLPPIRRVINGLAE